MKCNISIILSIVLFTSITACETETSGLQAQHDAGIDHTGPRRGPATDTTPAIDTIPVATPDAGTDTITTDTITPISPEVNPGTGGSGTGGNIGTGGGIGTGGTTSTSTFTSTSTSTSTSTGTGGGIGTGGSGTGGSQGTGGTTTPGTYVAKTIPSGKKVLVLTNSSSSTDAMVNHLTSRGLTVDTSICDGNKCFVKGSTSEEVDYASYDVLVGNSITFSTSPAANQIKVPAIFPAGGFNTNTEGMSCSRQGGVVVVDLSNPLISGRVTVTSKELETINGNDTACSVTNSSAHVALADSKNGGSLLYYYLPGDPLPLGGALAPALRIGFPYGQTSPWSFVGTALWNLFDQSLDFALGL